MPPELAKMLRDWIREVVREEAAAVLQGSSQEYLSTGEAAALARVSTRTVRRWIGEERLRAFGAGREIRVRKADIEGLMQRGRRRARAGASAALNPEALGMRLILGGK